MGRTKHWDANKPRGDSQMPLPFGPGQGLYDEERNRLGLALLRVHADLYLAQLMNWLFNATQAGRKGPLVKSYAQLAARPWGLCCSESKARATVNAVRRRKLARVETTWTSAGVQGPNALHYDADLIAAVIGLRRAEAGGATEHPGGATEHPGGATEHPGGATGHPDALLGHPGVSTAQAPIRNNTFSHLLAPSPTAARTQPGGGAGGLVLLRTAAPGKPLRDAARWETPDPALAGQQAPRHALPPPSSLEETAAAPAWEAIGRRLLALGVYADLSECLLAKARQRGATPADVTALADHFESRPRAWTAGALTIALKRWSPGHAYDAAALWPPPSDEYRLAARREAAERLRACEAAEERNRRSRLNQEREEAASLEARFGGRLDGLDESQLAELIAATPRAQLDVLAAARKERPVGGLLRDILLAALAAREVP